MPKFYISGPVFTFPGQVVCDFGIQCPLLSFKGAPYPGNRLWIAGVLINLHDVILKIRHQMHVVHCRISKRQLCRQSFVSEMEYEIERSFLDWTIEEVVKWLQTLSLSQDYSSHFKGTPHSSCMPAIVSSLLPSCLKL